MREKVIKSIYRINPLKKKSVSYLLSAVICIILNIYVIIKASKSLYFNSSCIMLYSLSVNR